MARLARVVAPGLPHHVTQRGNRRQQTCFCDEDYECYLELMARFCRAEHVEIWAYCLMPNHVHLIAVPQPADGLRRAIGEAPRRYTRMVYVREGWRGHLWQGRFASFVLDEPYLLTAARAEEIRMNKEGKRSRRNTGASGAGREEHEENLSADDADGRRSYREQSRSDGSRRQGESWVRRTYRRRAFADSAGPQGLHLRSSATSADRKDSDKLRVAWERDVDATTQWQTEFHAMADRVSRKDAKRTQRRKEIQASLWGKEMRIPNSLRPLCVFA
jgi:REP element-mobilizing transposase RayT